MDTQAKVDAIAMKALLLEPGDSFVVPVTGMDVEDAADLVEQAVWRQHGHAAGLEGSVADPEHITVCVAAGRVIVERVRPDE